MKSQFQLALQARRFFPNAERKQAASQAVKWAKAVLFLGEKHILFDKKARLSEPRPV